MDLRWVDELLDGIDKDDGGYDNGWWSTSRGAEFGAKRLAELKAEIGRRYGGAAHRIAELHSELEQLRLQVGGRSRWMDI